MKKFLSLILATLMLLSAVAFAEEAAPSVAPGATVGVPSVEVALPGEATPSLFVVDESEAAVAAQTEMLAAIAAAAAPIDVNTEETKAAVEAALGVNASDLVLAVEPVAINVNDDIAAALANSQILTLGNVVVGEKFVLILTLTTAGVKEEIVLTNVVASPEVNEVSAAIDLATIAKLQAADTIVVTVLTVAE